MRSLPCSMFRVPICAVIMMTVALVGCAPTFRSSFQRSPETLSHPPAQSVQVRGVTHAQIQAMVDAQLAYCAEVQTAPEDLDELQMRECGTRMLAAVQMKDSPDTIDYIGISKFWDTRSFTTGDQGLRDFAMSQGANVVLLASEFGDRVTQYQAVPTIGTSFGSFNANDGSTFVSGTASGVSTGTTYVPVTQDMYLTTAIYLRRLTPEESARSLEHWRAMNPDRANQR